MTQAESLRAALDGLLVYRMNSNVQPGDEFLLRSAVYQAALAATPPTEGLDQRLSDCEDALSTVEAAYDAATPPAEGLDEPSAEEWTANGLAAVEELEAVYYAGKGIPVAGFRAAVDAIRAALAATPPTEGLDVGDGPRRHELYAANAILDRPSADPDDDAAIVARAYLRLAATHEDEGT